MKKQKIKAIKKPASELSPLHHLTIEHVLKSAPYAHELFPKFEATIKEFVIISNGIREAYDRYRKGPRYAEGDGFYLRGYLAAQRALEIRFISEIGGTILENKDLFTNKKYNEKEKADTH